MSTFDTLPPDGISNVDEWLAARLGKVTASRVADATRRTKTGWSAYRESYKMELIAERLTGQSKQRYVSEAMLFGQQVERDALLAYEARAGVSVDTSMWFCPHPSIEWSGASPDALIGDDGMVQVKVPESTTFVRALINKDIDPDYHAQVQWELACTQRQWSDLILYDPRIADPKLRMLRWRIERDDLWISTTEQIVKEFLGEIDDAIKKLGAEVAAPKETRASITESDGASTERSNRSPLSEATPVAGAGTATGWSDQVPANEFSSIQSLIASGKLKKGLA